MKVIDLLNKIANGEEAPKKIKYENDIYIHIDNYCYFCNETNLILSDRIFANYSKLNAEIYIENEEVEEYKKIEKVLDIELLGECDNWIINPATNTKQGLEINPYILEAITRNFKELYHKQCELIDEVNKLKEVNNESK